MANRGKSASPKLADRKQSGSPKPNQQIAKIEYAIKWQMMDNDNAEQEQEPVPERDISKDIATCNPPRPKLPITTVSDAERIEHLSHVGECFRSLYTYDHLTDVVIHIDGKQFNSHKAVLITHSEYFKDCLIQSENETPAEIEITGMPHHSFQCILEYMYSGEIVLTPETIGDIHTAAHHLTIQCLLDRCEAKLQKYTSHDALVIMQTCSNKDSVIFHRAFQLVVTNFAEVVDAPALAQLAMNTFITLLISDDVVVDTEMDLFRAAVAWINFDREKRVKVAGRVLGTIRFCYMSPRELLTGSEMLKEIKNDAHHLMADGMWYSVAASNRKECHQPIVVPKKRKYTGDLPSV